MRLKQPFLKLPIRFDAEELAREVRSLPPSAWTPHPTGFVGNEAVRLVTPGGEDSDAIDGPMAATDSLNRCDYVRQIMKEIGGVWGRSRFMGPCRRGREVPSHMSTFTITGGRTCASIFRSSPIPKCSFTCGDKTVHMAAGECWIFDSFRWHDVQNKGSEQRIHLVLDTVGGGLLPDLMDAAEFGVTASRFFRPGERDGEILSFEKVNSPKVMSPWEMRCHLAFIREEAGSDLRIAATLDQVDKFIASWAAVWARFGTDDAGRGRYEGLLHTARSRLAGLAVGELMLPNEVSLERILEQLLFQMALATPDTIVTSNAASASNVTVSGSAHCFRGGFPRSVRSATRRR